ncbi:substrate-binding domain-containing protein [Ruminiclostridium cellobioparum]|uniref:Transcriptional regulator n=1 Tax=Ruminiclostridium cellobioparum subsp. termitidis CT1112 TaxID=1195236 RepID=S0FXB2_RUMCE|nr:GntR family transcriptional regulator [Ruminiclostridium cellobioparum]EMS73784.1 transcriptional regulator [Ruminiclostridium cellobioparum subsp. termitidis CT1112]
MKGQPLYLQISNDIINEICNGNIKPGERIMSESELSDKYRVSSITAKNAFIHLCNQGYIVRIKGKGSFVNTAENLNKLSKFRNSRHDRIRASIKAVGLILPTMKTGVDQQLLNAIEYEIARTDYMLLVKITRESQELESAAIRQFILNGVSGLIIFPAETELYNEDILKLSIEQFPFVFVDRYLKGLKANTVTTNNLEITKEAVDGMIKRRGGNIVFISPNSRNSVTFDRMKGFEDALLDNNIPINRNNYCMVDLKVEAFGEKYSIIKTFLHQSQNLNGIFCANQEMAGIVMQILENEYPDRISNLELCCFDGIENRHFKHIRQNINEIAANCVNILLGAIAGETDHIQTVVDAEYII